ncbi:enterochelin esterase [Paenibacillus darwinianus]|uniref:Enterochelin esterase n=1 Tax=Paenibacillus darwinianus TaxID=1380763 RepID=A0A9W5RZV9_9BACL|nr:alpha/beta hydrolase-fold protein [Paenibacillus darwinianus]EXX85685.1 enterochelin esterase [Paenibacillus darwinianus]EXX89923.1 enterochelin esterase [Paenibacillus darwinianus]EXX90764.1 enterochelin esterase [Paenibacillus darwinianus]
MSDSPSVKRTIVKETVDSRFLPEGSRSLRIFLPPGYNEVLSYPVVYCQDGEDFFNFGRIATQANALIAEGELEPLIIVGVDVDKKVRTAEYAPDGDRHERYVRFFAEELVPAIEQLYPVRREPEHILLAGDSLGGTVSLLIALQYPDKFGGVLSLSGAFYPSALAVLSSSDADLTGLRMYMTVGLQETEFETDKGMFDFVELNRRARKLLEIKGVKPVYIEREGTHIWGYWQKDVPDALRSFFPV